MPWQPVMEKVWIFRDSCNVYAVRGPQGIVIIDAGTGHWVSHLHELPARPVALLCTHHFRDHSAGALPANRAGIPIYVPEGELHFFADPVHHFNARSTYIVYQNHWDLFAPIEGVPVAGVLRDYDKATFAGLEFEIIPNPGVSIQQIALSVNLTQKQGKNARVIFCGEAIHSPGRMARLAPLQYNYNDLPGCLNAHSSALRLREHKPDVLLPSLGEPMLHDADAALEQLQINLRFTGSKYPDIANRITTAGPDPLERVTDHLWRTTHAVSTNWFLISKNKKALAIDFGYDFHHTEYSNHVTAANRRVLMHSIPSLKSKFGIDKIDVVLVSHFHDDHVAGIPLLQRLHGTQCWASEHFADLLEHPEAHCFPCNWPVPMRVDRRLKPTETFTWEEYAFHIQPMNGHTRFSSIIGFEADGKRIAHTGDQYFFIKGWNGNPMPSFGENERMQNHVYRNGALLDGYAESGKWMLAWKPEIVLQGHQATFHTTPAFFEHVEAWCNDYRQMHERSMVLGENETHMNIDSWGGWLWPYRTHHVTWNDDAKKNRITVKATVRNPLPHEAQLHVRLVGPTGWVGESKTLSAAARAEVSCDLCITPNGPCRRQPFAVELTVNEQPFGQVAEALATLGNPYF